jgi:hypothetical protein
MQHGTVWLQAQLPLSLVSLHTKNRSDCMVGWGKTSAASLVQCTLVPAVCTARHRAHGQSHMRSEAMMYCKDCMCAEFDYLIT